MTVQLVHVNYARFGVKPPGKGPPPLPIPASAQNSVHWGKVLLAGSVAWLLVGVAVGAACLSFRSPAARQPAVAPVAMAAPAAAPAPPRQEPQPARSEAARPAPAPAAAIVANKPADKKPAAPAPPAKAPPAPALPASERLLADLPPDFKNYGTQVDFVDGPDTAARLATQERKLCFTIHLSGNFEDARFT
jgi:hypothetical protein